jgi:[acyl-carrier-protein] S-malonyltransferase
VGMGAAVRRHDPALFDRWFEPAEAAAGLPLRRYALCGPPEALTRTDVAQPALFALGLALTELARERGLRPAFVAGHSLGEYVAAVAAGALGADDGFRLVAERGRLMAAVSGGAMGALIGLPAERVRELCARAGRGGVVVANLNSPTQVVVSGDEAAVEDVLSAARAGGVRRAVRLPVAAAFHSPAMAGAQARLAAVAERMVWSDPAVPLVVNASGELVRSGARVREALIAQIASEVRWTDCVATLLRAGCTTFLELGPAPVLAGLVRQIQPGVNVVSAHSPDRLEELEERRARVNAEAATRPPNGARAAP